MRSLLYSVTFLTMIGLAFWAYRENYQTQAALSHVEDLQIEIGAARERLGVLRAEWAYLNRPDRLRELAAINYERLGLMPLDAEHFGRVDQVAYPMVTGPDDLGPITDPIELSSNGADR